MWREVSGEVKPRTLTSSHIVQYIKWCVEVWDALRGLSGVFFWVTASCGELPLNCLYMHRHPRGHGFKARRHIPEICWKSPILLILRYLPMSSRSTSITPKQHSRRRTQSRAWSVADVRNSVVAVFFQSEKPRGSSGAVNIPSHHHHARQMMWDLILPMLLHRLSFVSFHLFMVTSAGTHQSRAISSAVIPQNNTHTRWF